MRKIASMLFVLFLLPPYLTGQYATENAEESFSEAQYFFARGDFAEAVYYYRELLNIFPDNSHLNFKAGECYLNMQGSEILAIPFLEKAVQNVEARSQYKDKSFSEASAPIHALFYLGNAYRISNRLAEALDAYYRFVNSPFYYGNYNIAIVENEIMSCERAKIIQDNPLKVSEETFGNNINTSFPEVSPVISQDGSMIAYIRKLQFYDALYISSLTAGTWSDPVNLSSSVGSDGDMYPACFSNDNNELYLIKKGKKNSDIYVSGYSEGSWTKARKIEGRVNSRAFETSAWLSSDGNTLYFSSSRKNGRGLDIYTAERNTDGNWVRVKNTGRTVNTRFDEEFPCLSEDGGTLYFSSKGHFNMGGYDVFTSKKIAKGWSLPVNIGYPINNTGDNTGYMVIKGNEVYYSRKNIAEGTEEDIYRITSSTPF
jgi:tetratricopeptide (TPR) repeat protein